MLFRVDSEVRMSSKNPSVETPLGDAMWQVSTQSPRCPAESGFPLAQRETDVCSAEHQMPQLVCVEKPHCAKTLLIKDQHHTLRTARCSYLREPWWRDVAPGPAGFQLWSSSAPCALCTESWHTHQLFLTLHRFSAFSSLPSLSPSPTPPPTPTASSEMWKCVYNPKTECPDNLVLSLLLPRKDNFTNSLCHKTFQNVISKGPHLINRRRFKNNIYTSWKRKGFFKRPRHI